VTGREVRRVAILRRRLEYLRGQEALGEPYAGERSWVEAERKALEWILDVVLPAAGYAAEGVGHHGDSHLGG
jgi:hypothetical protein